MENPVAIAARNLQKDIATHCCIPLFLIQIALDMQSCEVNLSIDCLPSQWKYRSLHPGTGVIKKLGNVCRADFLQIQIQGNICMIRSLGYGLRIARSSNA